MSSTLVIADDHEIVRIGLKALFSNSDLEVVAEAAGGNEAYKAVKKHRPNLVMLDVRMPSGDGLNCLARIKLDFPIIPVLMLSGVEDSAYMARAYALGASGYLLKAATSSEILSAVRTVISGGVIWKTENLRRITKALSVPVSEPAPARSLTPREIDVLKNIALGLTNKEIAAALGISYETVKEHVQHIIKKLGVTDRTGAAVWAVRQQLV